jgi:hypothetical protein
MPRGLTHPPPGPGTRTRSAAAGAGGGGAQEGAKPPAARAPGTKEREVPAAQAVGALLSRDRGVLVVGRGGGGGERWGPGSPRKVAALAPFAQSRGGGGGGDAWGGRRGARRQATNEGGDARRGGADAHHGDGRGCGGGHNGGGDDVRRAPEEKEEGIFHPEVSDRFPSRAFLVWPGPNFLVFVLAVWRPLCPLLRLPRC